MSVVHMRSSGGTRKFFRGREGDARWVRPALLVLLVLTGVAYIWGLDQSGWSNSFYSAAVQAASKSWKAFFYGSLDASNFITVDKPPASLWVMDLSVRIFGVNSWSILVPEALEGVACVFVLYCTIRRWFSPGAALLAGACLAVTPVAALMFRFNNPDALLVLLLTASAYALTRALEEGRTKWLVYASVLIGFGFLTKMLAAFLVVPGFVVVYALFAPISWRKRIWQIILSAITVIVSAGWWVAIVQLVPAKDRPYIGSSQNNSILNLIFGYNGLGRLSGNESGFGGHGGASAPKFTDSVSHVSSNAHAFAGGGMGAGFSGSTGLLRLFQADMGGQISWLIPAALVLFVVALWIIRRDWRTHKAVPALCLWLATFVVTGLAFSLGQGIIHTYYTIALAPAIAALVAIGADVLWSRRDQITARAGIAIAILATVIWAYALLDRSPNWLPWLRVCIVIAGGLAVIGMLVGQKFMKRMSGGIVAIAIVSTLAGPLAYTLQTVTTPHTGSTPTAGPSVSRTGFGGGSGGRFGGGFPGGATGEFGGRGGGQFADRSTSSNGTQPPSFPSGASEFTSSQSDRRRFSGGGSGGGFSGFGQNSAPSASVIKLLQTNASKYTWVLATSSSMSSDSYQLASGDPVMAMGGFSGSDPAITLAEFKQYVSEGKIHYYLADGMGIGGRGGFSSGNFGEHAFEINGSIDDARGGTDKASNTSETNTSVSGTPIGEFVRKNAGDVTQPIQRDFGGSSAISEITQWVESNFKTVTVGGVTFYDLTQPKS